MSSKVETNHMTVPKQLRIQDRRKNQTTHYEDLLDAAITATAVLEDCYELGFLDQWQKAAFKDLQKAVQNLTNK